MFLAASTMLMIPLTGFVKPSSDNSPTKSLSLVSLCKSCFDRIRIAKAMGRSK